MPATRRRRRRRCGANTSSTPARSSLVGEKKPCEDARASRLSASQRRPPRSRTAPASACSWRRARRARRRRENAARAEATAAAVARDTKRNAPKNESVQRAVTSVLRPITAARRHARPRLRARGGQGDRELARAGQVPSGRPGPRGSGEGGRRRVPAAERNSERPLDRWRRFGGGLRRRRRRGYSEARGADEDRRDDQEVVWAHGLHGIDRGDDAAAATRIFR